MNPILAVHADYLEARCMRSGASFRDEALDNVPHFVPMRLNREPHGHGWGDGTGYGDGCGNGEGDGWSYGDGCGMGYGDGDYGNGHGNGRSGQWGRDSEPESEECET